jgi:DNA-binding beta-propeller fold protein YncE
MAFMKKISKLSVFAAILVSLSLPSPCMAEKVTASYLFNLSNFMGILPYSWPKIFVDKKVNEIYVSDLSEATVSIFNANGMEIYQFSLEDLGLIGDVYVNPDGDLLMLTYNSTRSEYYILVCNFRGEPKSRIAFKNIPPEFSGGFFPDTMICQNGRIYLADKGRLKVVVVDDKGFFLDGYDLGAILQVEESKRSDWEIFGFHVDGEGNLLFTVPVQFRGYKLTPDRKIRAFGSRGSAPGKFNIVGGITTDDRGHYYITDLLRSVVMVFDNDFRFQTEFGYSGERSENLTSPADMAVDTAGKLYISQAGSRGVSVYKVSFE